MGKVALVTGGARGIGKSIVLELAKSGYDICINYNNSCDEANKLVLEVKKLNVKCICVKCDVSKENEVDNMFNIIESKLGGCDIVINNAGIDLPNLFQNKTVEEFKKTLDVNLIGAFIVSKRCYKYMYEKKWGRIINISSTNGINSYYPMCIDYDASKAALISLTHNLAIQFAPFINVNCICPGFIGTENELKDYDEDFLKVELDKIMVHRFGDPLEVAKLVKFLVSDDANYINNTIIRIDGGQYGSC